VKKFIAIQTGARRNYAVPALLETAGLLEAFYTDLCGNAGLGGLLQKGCPKSFKNSAIQRLISRQPPGCLQDKVRTFDGTALRYLVRSHFASSNPLRQHQALGQFDREFGQAMIQAGVGKATHVFSMFGEGSPFLRFAKDKGLQVISEVYIAPQTHAIAAVIESTRRESGASRRRSPPQ